jgi:hypothetical protein
MLIEKCKERFAPWEFLLIRSAWARNWSLFNVCLAMRCQPEGWLYTVLRRIHQSGDWPTYAGAAARQAFPGGRRKNHGEVPPLRSG